MKSGDARVALIGFPSVGKVIKLSLVLTLIIRGPDWTQLTSKSGPPLARQRNTNLTI